MSIRPVASRVSAGIMFALVVASAVGCNRGKSGLRTGPDDPEPFPGQKVARVEELLIGQPGVDVVRTGDGGYSVSIRGTGSFMSSEQPLYVIDGTPYEATPGRGLGWLNPQDVVRIDVLKNPTETSFYGLRGGNGVIVITTKKTP